jgi:hypothetical protein
MIWDAATGEQVKTLGTQVGITTLRVSRDAEHLETDGGILGTSQSSSSSLLLPPQKLWIASFLAMNG